MVDERNVTQVELPVDTALNIMLDVNLVPKYLSHEFTVTESFDEANGKYGTTLGNVAIIDCKYAQRFI